MCRLSIAVLMLVLFLAACGPKEPTAEEVVATRFAETAVAATNDGSFARFRGGRRLAKYSLLAPMANDSGDENPNETPKGRHIGKIGRRTLKWAWLEAAHSAIRKDTRFRQIYDARTDGGKRDRMRGLVAVARALCCTAWSMEKNQRNYQQEPPPRPGSGGKSQRNDPGTNKRHSRPVKGQSLVAMVPAASLRRQTSL